MGQHSANVVSRSAMVEFWLRVQQFLLARRNIAKNAGLESREYEVMLTLKACPEGRCPNVAFVAEQLLLHHHVAAKLVKGLVARGIVVTARSKVDRRSLALRLSPVGDRLLEEIVERSVDGLREEGPEILRALTKLLGRQEVSQPDQPTGATATT
jgi:DNA-binding MarR family transcriptional regulator